MLNGIFKELMKTFCNFPYKIKVKLKMIFKDFQNEALLCNIFFVHAKHCILLYDLIILLYQFLSYYNIICIHHV